MSNGLATHLEIEFSDAMSFGVRTVVKVRLGCVTEREGKISGEGMIDPLVPSIPTQTPGPHIPNIHLNLFLSVICPPISTHVLGACPELVFNILISHSTYLLGVPVSSFSWTLCSQFNTEDSVNFLLSPNPPPHTPAPNSLVT